MLTSGVVRLRCALLAASATAALTGALSELATGVTAPAHDVDAALLRLCTVALLLALTWGWLTVLAGVLEAWRSVPPGRAGPVRRDAASSGRAPTGVRRVVLACCGVALSGTLSGTSVGVLPGSAAHAATTSRPSAVTAPDRHRAAAAAPGQSSSLVPGSGQVLVHRGDCLWSIAAREVQAGAGPATVTARWRAIYRANRGRIGADPDVIHPGQRLRLPR